MGGIGTCAPPRPHLNFLLGTHDRHPPCFAKCTHLWNRLVPYFDSLVAPSLFALRFILCGNITLLLGLVGGYVDTDCLSFGDKADEVRIDEGLYSDPSNPLSNIGQNSTASTACLQQCQWNDSLDAQGRLSDGDSQWHQ
jgi:hypothetical protein